MAPPSEHKHVLIVDDESSTRLIVERILRGGIPGVRVSCAADGAHALALLDREQVDLLITDLAMPVIDGIELLLQIARRRLLIPVLVMSAHGSVSEARALAGGAIEFFSKPIRAAPLLDAVKNLLATPLVSASLEVVSLAGLVRIVGMERKTCALRVTGPDGQGVLIFVDGELVDARQDTLNGLAAALAVFALKDPFVTLELTVRSRARTIDLGLTEVLRRAYLAATVPRSLASTAPARAASELEQPPDFRGVAPPKQARAERPAATTAARKTPIAPAPKPSSTARRPDIRPPTISPPSAAPSQPVVPPPPVLSPPPPTLLRSPPLASRTVTPPPVPAPPRVTASPRAPLLSSPTTLRQRAGTLLSQVGAPASTPANGTSPPTATTRSPEAPPQISAAKPAQALGAPPATPASIATPAPPEASADISTLEPTQPTPPEAATEISTREPATPATPEATPDISTREPATPATAEISTLEPATPAPAEISTREPATPAPAEISTLKPATPAPAPISTLAPATPAPAPISTLDPATPAPPEATADISTLEPTPPAEPASAEPPAPIAAAPPQPLHESTDTQTATAQGHTPADTVDPREQAAQAPADAPTTAAPTPVVTATIEGLDSTDYFELMDRAHDLMRVAEFEIADLLLQRALQLRPGDRVVQQNLRVLAKRRGSSPAVNR